MRLITFLAGIATGMLLAQRMARDGAPGRAQQRPSAGGNVDDGRETVSDEDSYPMRSLSRSDEQIRERIRSQMARTIADPEAVQVEVSGGCVTLRGRLQASDVILLMAEVEKTTGVTEVRNEARIEGSLDEVTSPMTRDAPVVRAGELASSRMS